MRGRAAYVGAAILLVTILVGAACSRAEPAVGPLPVAPEEPAPTAPAPVSPLTGLPADLAAPVLAVKVDNSPAGRPWRGVDQADVVYVEPVEGGITRLLAIFSSHMPRQVGPVRSFRESDLGVLAAYGHPGLTYSGNAPELNAALAAAPVVPLSPERVRGAFTRDDARRAPDNLYATTGPVLAAGRAAGPLSGPRDVGFVFGPAPAGGAPTPSDRVTVGRTPLELDWDPAGRRWFVSFDGRRAVVDGGAPVVPATVVELTVTTRESAVHDVAGTVSPVAETVGAGNARVLRDGRSFDARWTRASPGAPLSLLTPAGQPATLAPGPVWVLLVPRG